MGVVCKLMIFKTVGKVVLFFRVTNLRRYSYLGTALRMECIVEYNFVNLNFHLYTELFLTKLQWKVISG
jgi:hypothetical protein